MTGAQGAWVKHVQQLVAAWRGENAEMRDADVAPIRPERICREISEVLPPNGVVVSDTGHAGIWTARFIEFKHATQGYFRTAGSLGWGFPAALGVKCALPDRPVVCFTGDGGFYYHIAELETARRHNINAVIVVNNNSALNQEINLNKEAYGGKQRGRAEEMWRFPDVNFAKIAEGFGCVGMRVERPGDLRDALKASNCDEQTGGGGRGVRHVCDRAASVDPGGRELSFLSEDRRLNSRRREEK